MLTEQSERHHIEREGRGKTEADKEARPGLWPSPYSGRLLYPFLWCTKNPKKFPADTPKEQGIHFQFMLSHPFECLAFLKSARFAFILGLKDYIIDIHFNEFT